MKKILAILLAVALVFTLVACGSGTQDPGTDKKVYKIALLLPYIGDQSYFDSINNGRIAADEKYDNVETKLIEMQTDQSKWESFYTDACEAGYDLIISGSTDCEPYMYQAAEKYPQQLFYNFDKNIDKVLPNVYATTISTSELGYVAGVAACLITASKMPNANPDLKVGVIVGKDNPYMNEFIGSFCQVCIAKGVQVYIGYPDAFDNPAKAKELSLNMYSQGVDVIWQVAGGSGAGVFEAAAASNRYALGVDQDQTIDFAGQPELAKTIVTSFYKNFSAPILYAVEKLVNNEYPAGKVESLGIAEGAVGYIENDQFKAMCPEEIRNEIAKALEEVKSGKVEVFSVLANQDGWASIKAQATAGK